MYSFPTLELVCCFMFSSNCCFLTCIQISQVAGQVVWYSHFFKNFPKFFVVHTVKGFGIVNKAEADAFLELSCFFDDPVCVGNLISGSSAFSKFSFLKLFLTGLYGGCSVAKSCLTLCNPMNYSRPGLTVPHYLWICPSSCPLNWWYHPTISSSSVLFCFCFNLSQHQGLFQWVDYSQQVAKLLDLQLQHQSFQWVFRVDFL